MKKLANLKPGAYFFYGGVQWVVLENNDKIGATLEQIPFLLQILLVS